MRVKKPTSKRMTTRLREGIKKKAAAQNRKNRKLAKKDVTWRSKNKKDPGIPASFPYKDKIILELEEQKRLEKEKKEEAKIIKLKDKNMINSNDAPSESMEIDTDDKNDLAALVESAQQAAEEYDDSEENSYSESDIVEYELEQTEYDDHETEKSRKAYDKIFKAVVEASDVVLYVLDARDPESTRSRKVEEEVLQAQGKRLILVLNKIDLIPPDNLKSWLNFLKSSFPTVPVKASQGNSSFNKKLTSSMTANSLLQALKSYAAKSNLKRSIMVGVIGYPNVGKSSIINALTNRHGNHTKACPVGNEAGITTSLREVKIDGKLKILDSPGIVFPDELISSKKPNKKQQLNKLALLSALPPKQIADPISVVKILLKKFSANVDMAQGLKQYYNLPPIPSHDINEFLKLFLIHIARSKGRLGRGGVPNLESAAMAVLNDWRDGRILGWTSPKTSKAVESLSIELEDTLKTELKGKNEPPRVENTTIVNTWAKEFDLDGLLGDNFGLE